MTPHYITLQGGPYHAQTRPVPEPPPFEPSWVGVNKYSPSLYYAFHKVGDTWAPVAIYIQDPYTRDLFHYHADTTVKDPQP
jgi:hypothetical protein